MPVEIKSQFESQAVSFDLKRGDRVYQEGDRPQGIYFVKSGLIGLTKIGKSGKEHLLRFFRQGQFFGHRALFSNEEYHGTTIALGSAKLKLVPKSTVQEAIRLHPVLLQEVVEVLAKELRRCENQHVMILENQINARVAQSIIFLKDLNPEHNWTRQEIANFCASTVSTVIKSLAELEDMGLINQQGRNIIVLDRERLLAVSEESQI